jgi:hypothetical protein
MSRALEWRFGAITSRLDALQSHTNNLEAHLETLDERFAELIPLLDELRRVVAGAPQAAEDASAVRNAIELRVQPVLRAILDGEADNRRRLFELRSTPAYEEAYSDPDPLVSITVATVGREDVLVNRALPSLLSQTHTNLEVLVVGDAATTELEEAVKTLGDPRVHYANLSQRLVAHSGPALAGGKYDGP